MANDVSIIAAFTAGFLSFLAPCILPLIPPYFAWILGASEGDFLQTKGLRLKIFFHGLFLVLGFSVIFVILGASASWLGRFLSPHRLLVQRIGGAFIIIFGLEFIGFLRILKNHKTNLVKKFFAKFSHKTSSILVGATFAFAWVACFSPILGSILVLASFQGTLGSGIILLGFYSLGLAMPFILASLFIGLAIERIKMIAKITRWINLFSGLILLLTGALFVSDTYYKVVMGFSKMFQ